MTPIDDLLGEAHPVNVPGTSNVHANWRRKYSMNLEHFGQSDVVMTLTGRLRAGRNIKGNVMATSTQGIELDGRNEEQPADKKRARDPSSAKLDREQGNAPGGQAKKER